MKKIICSLSIIFLLGFVANNFVAADLTIEEIYFSSTLHVNDQIKWRFVNYIYQPGYELTILGNNTEIVLTIKKDLNNVNFVNIPISEYEEYFNLEVGTTQINFDKDDLLFSFLMPVEAKYSNGTVINPCKKTWILWMWDGIYSKTKGTTSIALDEEGDIAIYNTTVFYSNTDEKSEMYSKIDTKMGVMLEIDFVLTFASNGSKILHATFENIYYPTSSNEIPISIVSLVLAIMAIPITRRKKK